VIAEPDKAKDNLRCPKCGKQVESLQCGHCGSQLPDWQADLYGATIRQLAKMGAGKGAV
jgi:DNA-directed RNA polymerase subunit RPC12/RpoP